MSEDTVRDKNLFSGRRYDPTKNWGHMEIDISGNRLDFFGSKAKKKSTEDMFSCKIQNSKSITSNENLTCMKY